MQKGDKIYTYYSKNLGTIPADIVIVEGEVMNTETKNMTNFRGDDVQKDIVEIKVCFSGAKYLFDGVAQKSEDDGEIYEWAVVYKDSDFFNIWYKDKHDCMNALKTALVDLQKSVSDTIQSVEDMLKE